MTVDLPYAKIATECVVKYLIVIAWLCLVNNGVQIIYNKKHQIQIQVISRISNIIGDNEQNLEFEKDQSNDNNEDTQVVQENDENEEDNETEDVQKNDEHNKDNESEDDQDNDEDDDNNETEDDQEKDEDEEPDEDDKSIL